MAGDWDSICVLTPEAAGFGVQRIVICGKRCELDWVARLS
jgi:hypothetical protein